MATKGRAAAGSNVTPDVREKKERDETTTQVDVVAADGGDLGFKRTLSQAADKLRNNMDAADSEDGQLIDEAMGVIETDSPSAKDMLPKAYGRPRHRDQHPDLKGCNRLCSFMLRMSDADLVKSRNALDGNHDRPSEEP